MPESAVDEGAGMTTHRPDRIAAVEPEAQSRASEREKPAAGASSPQMPIALPGGTPAAAADAATVQTIEVARIAHPKIADGKIEDTKIEDTKIENAKRDDGSDTTVDQADAKAGPGGSAKSREDGPQEQHDMRRGDADFPDVRLPDIRVPDIRMQDVQVPDVIL